MRKRHHLSQEQLAARLGIKRSNIAAYESKNVEPRLRIILELARLFDIQLKTLIEKRLSMQDHFRGFQDEESVQDDLLQSTNIKHIKGKKGIKSFVESSVRIRKILEGFKAFYNFRTERIKEKTPELSRLMVDIENFIQLTEYLLTQNEFVIKAISSKDQGNSVEQEPAE